MKKYILLCDDDKDLNLDIQEDIYLDFNDIEIHSVFDRETALKAVSERAYSIAIIDLNLENTSPPNWSNTGGVEIIKYINNQNFGTKIIVLSGNPETELSFDLSKKYNISKYIQKGSESSTSKILETIKPILNEESDMVKNLVNKNQVFSGTKGLNTTKWESDVIELLNLKGIKGLNSISLKILNKYYPFKHFNMEGLRLNRVNKTLHGDIWSFKNGQSYHLYVFNKKLSKTEDFETSNRVITHKLYQDIFVSLIPTDISIECFNKS